MTLEQRFWSKVDIKGPNECWEWKASCYKEGYGKFKYENKIVRTHRMAWKLTNGPIPEGMCICHHCDNPKCCNAENTEDHLFLGTLKDNSKDMVNKDRQAKGEHNGNVKLTESQVIEIKKLRKEGYKQQQLADIFGLHQPQISAIINNKYWKHLQG